MEADLYKLLGVSSEAPERAIKRAYHDLARKKHPDKAASPEESRRLEEEFAALTRAYNILKDAERRKEYDAKRAQQVSEDGVRLASTPTPAPAASTAASAGAAPAKGSEPLDKAVESGRLAIAERSYSRGLQLHNMGDHARSVEFFETAIRNNPNEARYHARLAQALMKSRRGFTRSVEAAQRACQIDQYNIEFKLILAQIYERAGSVTLARREYENVLKWDAENLEAARRLEALRGGESGSTFAKLWNKLTGKRK